MADRGARPPRVLVVAGNSFLNKGDAALLLSLDAELRRLLPDAEVTYSLRSPRRARLELPHRRVIPQFLTATTAPLARPAALALRLDARLTPAVAVAQAVALVALVRLHGRLRGRAPRLARRMLPTAVRRMVEEVQAADVVVAAPGGYLLTAGPHNVAWMLAVAPLMTAAALGVAHALAPMTIGPIPRVQRPAARLALARADLVLLREGRSRPWAELCGARPDRIAMSADMAWITAPASRLPEAAEVALARPGPPGAAGPLVGVAVRDFEFPRSRDPVASRTAYLEAVATALDRLIEQRGIRPVFLPQVLMPPVTDLDVAREVLARMRHPAHLLDADLSAGALCTVYGRLDAILGVRMHAGILAMAAGTPFVGIAYGIKHAGIMADLGLGRYLSDISTVDAGWLVDAVGSALDDGPALRALLATRVPLLADRVREGSERLAGVIRAASATATD